MNNSISCLLCFQTIEEIRENENNKPENGYSAYKEVIFECSRRLFSEYTEESFNWTYSKKNFILFCEQCFNSAEQLWIIEEELKNCIKTFSKKLLQSRYDVSSKISVITEKYDNNTDCFNGDNENTSTIINKNSLPFATGLLDTNIVKEERLDISISDGFCEDLDTLTWHSDPVIEETSNFEQESSIKFRGPSTNAFSKLTKGGLELKVSLARLQFDSEGQVQSSGIEGRVKRKASVAATKLLRKKAKRDPLNASRNTILDNAEISENSKFTNYNKKTERRSKKSRRNSRKGPELKCVECSSVFNFAVELDEHSEETGHVNERKFECSKCFKKFYRSMDLAWHRKVCYFEPKECVDCGKVCETYHIYQKHRKCHSENPMRKRVVVLKPKIKAVVYRDFTCIVCFEKFGNGNELDSHSEKSGHSNERLIQCDHCPKNFYRKQDLSCHKFKSHKHEETENLCTHCGKTFTNLNLYNTHLQTHAAEKKYKCPHCDKHFSARNDWVDHQNNHTGERPYHCDENECIAKFLNKKALATHKRHHAVLTNVQCKICNLFYKNEKSLEFHMGIHTGKIKHDCDSCEVSFTLLKHLTSHKILTHKMESPFKCKHCEITFNYKIELNVHLKNEHNEKLAGPTEPSTCEVCGKTYLNRSALARHRYSHTTIKIKKKNQEKGLFQCDQCGKEYPFMNSLREHTRQFHSNLIFICDFCGKILRNLPSFKVHMKIHSDNFFDCKLCGRGFTHKQNLKAHMKRIHEQNKKPKKSYTKTPFAKTRPTPLI